MDEFLNLYAFETVCKTMRNIAQVIGTGLLTNIRFEDEERCPTLHRVANHCHRRYRLHHVLVQY